MTDAQGRRQLPERLSDVLHVAADDAEAAIKNRNDYAIDMNHWHRPMDDGRCAVGVSGAVMARTLGADPTKDLSPCDFTAWDRDRLWAINDVRLGLDGVPAALSCLHGRDYAVMDYGDKCAMIRSAQKAYGEIPGGALWTTNGFREVAATLAKHGF